MIKIKPNLTGKIPGKYKNRIVYQNVTVNSEAAEQKITHFYYPYILRGVDFGAALDRGIHSVYTSTTVFDVDSSN
jgi:hypothetical protein